MSNDGILVEFREQSKVNGVVYKKGKRAKVLEYIALNNNDEFPDKLMANAILRDAAGVIFVCPVCLLNYVPK